MADPWKVATLQEQREKRFSSLQWGLHYNLELT